MHILYVLYYKRTIFLKKKILFDLIRATERGDRQGDQNQIEFKFNFRR